MLCDVIHGIWINASFPLDFFSFSVWLSGWFSFLGVYRLMICRGISIGGIKETQEMLNFCAEHNISCMIENIPIDYVNTTMERLVKGDVKYYFVINVAESYSTPMTNWDLDDAINLFIFRISYHLQVIGIAGVFLDVRATTVIIIWRILYCINLWYKFTMILIIQGSNNLLANHHILVPINYQRYHMGSMYMVPLNVYRFNWDKGSKFYLICLISTFQMIDPV